MNIYKKVFREIINNVPSTPPEIGGILGEHNNVVSHVKFDCGLMYTGKKKCGYMPDTKKLNKYIEGWQREGINFCGIFHTHFYGVETLSDGDINYIKKNMNALPEGTDCLYFPIVILPKRKIKVYSAFRKNTHITISYEELRIVNDVD